MPAATDLAPSRTIAWASTVAVVVPSPAASDVRVATSRTSWAPMFSNLSESSISLATVTPSLVMRGEPYDLSSTTLRPLGPSVTFTESARISTPRIMRARASPPKRTSFAAMVLVPCFMVRRLSTASGGLLVDDAHDVDSFMIRRSSPSSLISVPDHLPNRMRSPCRTSRGTTLPASSRAPGPTATISPSIGFSWAVSGIRMPPVVLISGSTRRITTRSCSGLNFMAFLSICSGFFEGERRAPTIQQTVER